MPDKPRFGYILSPPQESVVDSHITQASTSKLADSFPTKPGGVMISLSHFLAPLSLVTRHFVFLPGPGTKDLIFQRVPPARGSSSIGCNDSRVPKPENRSELSKL
ncbi:hypothetical protein H2248_012118 [Termitomyces sp. 'cryptogamus']|nr:hypothetical protein H2248_012118 [Termitomyces sp. 'cryptogamus']